MSLGSVVIQHNPVVGVPPGGSFNLPLYPTGTVRIDPNSYQHKIQDMGGFHTCKFDVIGPDEVIGEMMDNGLGREVRTYNHQGLVSWYGIITTMRQATQISTRIETLEKAANKIKVYLNIKQISQQVTVTINDTDMQNAYGILELVDSLNVRITDNTRADTRAELLKKDLADPHRLKEFRDKGDLKLPIGISKLSVFASGYIWYLKRRLYNSYTKGNGNASTVIDSIITAVGQFVDSSSVETNTQQAWKRYNNDDMAWDVITTLGETGDTADERFIAGMYENRKFVYEKRAATTLPNITLWKDSKNNITDRFGRPLAGMLVRPNTYLRNVPIKNRPGKVYTDIWDDPQVAYISEVTYTEKDQLVKVTSEEALAKPSQATIEIPSRSPGPRTAS